MRIPLFFFVFSFVLSAQAELSDIEGKISEIARGYKEPAVSLLEEVVNINSGTMNHNGVRQVGDVFRRELDALGMTTSWYDMGEVDRAGHLFAESGSGGACQLLIGHLDTVFEPNSPFQTFQREGDFATGPGVNDMKGGNVVIVYALKALLEAGVLDQGQFIVALIGDEEKSGNPKSISRSHLIEAAERCDYALGFEIATSLSAATVARRGSSGWQLEVTGKQAHSSRIFSEDVGSGAIFEAARILNQFHAELTGEQYLTFNPGLILGGTEVRHDAATNSGSAFGKSNVVSNRVVVQGGLRFISRAQLLKARESMQRIVDNGHRPLTDASISFADGYPAMSPTLGNQRLLSILSRASEDLGYGPVEAYDPGKRGAADVSFVAPYIDAIDGLGAEGQGAHSPEESIDLNTLPMLIERAALFMYRLAQQ